MDESRLLQEYASSRSDDAFKAIVDQYVGLVYSACVRQLRDRHLAEDAAQAVFILLSQKAGALSQTHLAGWLLTTSRFACSNIRRSQTRRQRREQVAAMNTNIATETPSADLLDLLDEGLCHLKTVDREALVLRYLKERPLSEIAAELGVSEEAARKRVNRGVEKLRKYFLGRGIDATSAVLGPILTDQLRGAGLTPAVRRAVTQGILQVCHAGAHSGAASVAIAKGTKTMMVIAKLKTAAAVAAIAAAVGTTGWAISRAVADSSAAPQVAAPANVAPVSPPAAEAVPTAPAATQPVIDLSTPEKAFVSFIAALKAGDRDLVYQCLTADPNREPLMIDRILDWNLATNRMLAAAREAYGPDSVPQLMQGSTIDEVAEMALMGGAWQHSITGDTAVSSAQVPPGIANMLPPGVRPIVLEWSGAPIRFQRQGGLWKFDIDRTMRVVVKCQYEIPPQGDEGQQNAAILEELTASIDQTTSDINTGQLPTLAEAVEAHRNALHQLGRENNGLRSFSTTIVPVDAPAGANADNGAWQFHKTPTVYTAAMDPNTLHDGHATLRIFSDTAVRSQTAHYQRMDSSPGQYLGHRIEVSAWIKSDQVLDDAGLRIRVLDADGNVLADEGQRKERPVKGTNDWKMYTAYADVPENAAAIQWGFILNGSGTIWADLDSAHIGIADDAAP